MNSAPAHRRAQRFMYSETEGGGEDCPGLFSLWRRPQLAGTALRLTIRAKRRSRRVTMPIIVEGDLWGAITLNAKDALPPDSEQRLEKFTELVATAIANAEGKSELAASRMRIVTASDEARRRIEGQARRGNERRGCAFRSFPRLA